MRNEKVQQKQFPEYRARTDWSRSAVLGERSAAARDFADLVASRLVGTVLPWSQRESLVRLAALQGIGRFEANLIIAAVQHQLGVGRKRAQENRPSGGRRISAALTLFVVVQAGIVAAVWHWLF